MTGATARDCLQLLIKCMEVSLWLPLWTHFEALCVTSVINKRAKFICIPVVQANFAYLKITLKYNAFFKSGFTDHCPYI